MSATAMRRTLITRPVQLRPRLGRLAFDADSLAAATAEVF